MFLVVGESLVDVVERPDGTRHEHAGGSPANVAVGLGRVGLDVTLATALADDAYGELIRWHLAESRVDVLASAAQRTSSAVARLDEHGAATYEFDVSWNPGPIEPGETPVAVHTGSIATVLEPGAGEVAALVRRLHPTTIVTFDPNVRPSMTPDRAAAAARIEELVVLADVVKASDEDLAWLYPGESLDAVAEQWLASGASLVVVTQGGDGSVAWSRSGRVDVPLSRVDVIDSVGAGDAYMSGLIVALHLEGLLDAHDRDRLRKIDAGTVQRLTAMAARSAAIVVGRAGAEPPWRTELLDHSLK
jgi:fructokinase